MKLLLSSFPLLIAIVLSACQQNQQHAENSALPENQQVQVNRGRLLATVDGERIYESELELLLNDLFGEYRATQIDQQSRKRALESLVSSRALSTKASKELEVDELENIELKTTRYRENLMVNAYVQKKMKSSNLNYRDVQEFYQNNLDKFGQKTIKQYRMLTLREDLGEEKREEFMQVISRNRSDSNIDQLGKILENKGFENNLQTGELNKDLLDPKLFQFIDKQAIGNLSDIYFLKGNPYLVQVLKQTVIPAKPLDQVSEQIQKAFVLKQIKETIKQQSEEVLSTVKVEYFDTYSASNENDVEIN
jgi:hypothetical protein